jgi:hypothetical protein
LGTARKTIGVLVRALNFGFVRKNVGVRVHALKFGDTRKNVGVLVHALNFGPARKNVGVRVHALNFGVTWKNVVVRVLALNLALCGVHTRVKVRVMCTHIIMTRVVCAVLVERIGVWLVCVQCGYMLSHDNLVNGVHKVLVHGGAILKFGMV